MADWVAFATESLQMAREEEDLMILSQETSEADACRSSASDEGDDPIDMAAPLADKADDEDVPLKPFDSDTWWVQLLKTHTANVQPGGVPSSCRLTVLSACTGCFAEGFALQAGLWGRGWIPWTRTRTRARAARARA